jgi:hypothetical protein
MRKRVDGKQRALELRYRAKEHKAHAELLLFFADDDDEKARELKATPREAEKIGHQ